MDASPAVAGDCCGHAFILTGRTLTHKVDLNADVLQPDPQGVPDGWFANERHSLKARTLEVDGLCIRCVTPRIGKVPLDQLLGAHVQQCYSDILNAGLARRKPRFSLLTETLRSHAVWDAEGD